MYIYFNGEYVSQEKVRISPFDHGFLYGLGVFETFRIYNGHPFLLDDHFRRLERSVKELNIIFDLKKEDLREIVNHLLTINDLEDAYVRFNVSAGEAPVGLRTEAYNSPNIIAFIKPIYGKLVRTKQAVLLNTPRNTPEGKERLKSHHYLNNIVGKREVPNGDQEGIFLTIDGYVAEGIVSNVFWVKNGQVFTPSVNTGILNGITRQFIIQILKDNKMPCREGYYMAHELLEADEVFVTNSIQEVVAISMVDKHEYTKDKKVTTLLQDLYQKHIYQRLWSIEERT
ncbi:4-amino-4-deoxychorismate lyase [Anaerobacillus alkalidiazotrophicus]|uniref:4-amino-4-deoxychorismate lyase n=1 Tax=Anaerobacillus alkalidiazotrophicus TaxID=472963 RepID=A0A1S2M715_9BACI|nr:aminodeoxychorismate lyase [Anaerobacillus alkalidiazotrophicus]OIJ20498.1 4-amino-4-deoxychorismate lyase [Anaerobacillus alkalidiazotrophicus]